MERPTYRFPEPKRKRQWQTTSVAEAAFPVPIRSVVGLQASSVQWNYFRGRLVGTCVYIDDTASARSLYQMGFFGKGQLSRAGLQHNADDQQGFSYMSKRRYLTHLKWAEGDMDSEDASLPYAKKVKSTNSTETETLALRRHAAVSECEAATDRLTDAWATSDTEHTEAFWAHSSVRNGCIVQDRTCESNASEVDVDKALLTAHAAGTAREQTCGEPVDTVTVATGHSVSVLEANISSTTRCISSAHTDSNTTHSVSGGQCQPVSSGQCQPGQKLSNNIATADSTIDVGVTGGSELSDSCVDERCIDSDSDADTCVVDDTEDSDVDDKSIRSTWRTVMKKDPYPVKEQLLLSLEEAFFLSYGLGCLVVRDIDETLMDLNRMWQMFSRLSPKFPERYVAYHNFRSKGWVPQTGLKFGTDFVLYKQGPPFYHASYSVVVKQVDCDFSSQIFTSWTSLAALSRVTQQVSKELMICYVIKPPSDCNIKLLSPSCIDQFTVMELVVNRWVSKKERENTECNVGGLIA